MNPFLCALLYSVAAFGIAFCVGYAKISFRIRESLAASTRPLANVLVDLLECPGCIGFWIGATTAPFMRDWLGARSLPLISFIVLNAFYTCGSNFILGRVSGLIPSEEKNG